MFFFFVGYIHSKFENIMISVLAFLFPCGIDTLRVTLVLEIFLFGNPTGSLMGISRIVSWGVAKHPFQSNQSQIELGCR